MKIKVGHQLSHKTYTAIMACVLCSFLSLLLSDRPASQAKKNCNLTKQTQNSPQLNAEQNLAFVAIIPNYSFDLILDSASWPLYTRLIQQNNYVNGGIRGPPKFS